MLHNVSWYYQSSDIHFVFTLQKILKQLQQLHKDRTWYQNILYIEC